MLTNRHHVTRWSLEQNREVPVEEAPIDAWKRKRWVKSAAVAILTTAILYTFFTIMFRLLDPYIFPLSEEYESLRDATEKAIVVNDHREQDAHGVLLPVNAPKAMPNQVKHNYAYVTLLCDNSGLANARVLAYALRRSKAEYPLIVMATPFATEGLEDLISLGATIEKITLIPTTFKRSNGKRPSFSRTCKFSKIHAWSLTKYSKLVYLDSSLLIVNVLSLMRRGIFNRSF